MFDGKSMLIYIFLEYYNGKCITSGYLKNINFQYAKYTKKVIFIHASFNNLKFFLIEIDDREYLD